MVSFADQQETSPSLGAKNCETVATFGSSWEAQCSGAVPADQNVASPSLGGANCETDASFGGSWEAQRSGGRRKAEGGLAGPGGRELRNRHHFRGLLGGPAEWCHTKTTMKNEASPSLGATNCETVATFVGSWGLSGMVSYADQSEVSLSLRVASWEAQRGGVICRPERGLHVPGG